MDGKRLESPQSGVGTSLNLRLQRAAAVVGRNAASRSTFGGQLWAVLKGVRGVPGDYAAIDLLAVVSPARSSKNCAASSRIAVVSARWHENRPFESSAATISTATYSSRDRPAIR